FDNESIIEFFEDRGVKLKEEDHGRMFPVSNKAQDVVDTLVSTINEQQVTVKEETAVTHLSVNEDGIFKVETAQQIYEAMSVI
ncbi:NAD(P)/FAD-dependent oxidoreductase, partial [Staphylococcus epidermidis]